ncbi:hypothetical protein [Sphingobium sp.]|uniref:hypothetical protein n=1 Tax=Sphingobium sp. TaxID=1912891 RepID=UPI002C8B2241|nr:hypothetical protein [Sphingobium sp.]HUD94008.1 hypothetical protein [Sphingobium sp.]
MVRVRDAAWAAQRSGLYYTPVNWHLTADEVGHIVKIAVLGCCRPAMRRGEGGGATGWRDDRGGCTGA